MTDKAKQIEKIRKLMALAAQSSNDGESANAFSRARRYMANYGLTMEDVYGKGGPSSGNSAENERYRHDAQSARQQAEAERRAREAAEKKNAQYEAEEKKRRDEEYFRQQAEKKAREQQREADEAFQRQAREFEARRQAEARDRKAAADAQLKSSSAAEPPKQSASARWNEASFNKIMVACAVLAGLYFWSQNSKSDVVAPEPQPVTNTQSPPAQPSPVPQEIAPLTISGYSIKSQSTRYCVSDDISDPDLSTIRRVQFANDHSLRIDNNNAMGLKEMLGHGVYRLINDNTITLSSDSVITDISEGGRTFSCYGSLKQANRAARVLENKYQAQIAQDRAPVAPIQPVAPAEPVQPVAPPRPQGINIYEYSAKSRDTRSCLEDGTQSYEGSSVNYKLQTFFFVSPSEIAYGKNTSGIRVIQAEGNGMYKLETGDEVGVDVFGTIQRYWTKNMSFTCFADSQELVQYLSNRAPQQ